MADFLSAVIVDEKSVWDYNRGITSRDGVNRIESAPPEEKLVPIYPTDGFYVADNPAYVLTGRWVDDAEAAAAEDFVALHAHRQGQQIVRESGYRDLNGELDPLVAEGRPARRRGAGRAALPQPNVIARDADAFPEVRKRAEVLFLLDVSGSMEETIASGQHEARPRRRKRSRRRSGTSPRRQRRPRRVLVGRRRPDHPGALSARSPTSERPHRLPQRPRRAAADRVHAALRRGRHVRRAARRGVDEPIASTRSWC